MRRLVAGGLLLVVGCFSVESGEGGFARGERGLLVIPESVQQMTRTTSHRMVAPATEESGKKLGVVARKVMEANPKLGVRPVFLAHGAPYPDLYHQWTGPLQTCQVYITEGLLKECKTDGQLAALLCTQLGKAVSERTTMLPPGGRTGELPPSVSVGNEVGGAFGASDGTRQLELARADAERKRDRAPVLPPDPEELARRYLQNAGYPLTDLEAAAPLLRLAEDHATWEAEKGRGKRRE